MNVFRCEVSVRDGFLAPNFVSNSAAVGSVTATTLALKILVAGCPTTGVSRVTITGPSWTIADLSSNKCSRGIPAGGNRVGIWEGDGGVFGVLRDAIDALIVLDDDTVQHTVVPVTLQISAYLVSKNFLDYNVDILYGAWTSDRIQKRGVKKSTI